MIEFTVYGSPVAKGRPRFRNRGNFVQTYTDEKTANYEQLVYLAFLNSGCSRVEGDIPLVGEIEFYMDIPKSVSKKKRQQMINNELRPLKKIDLDNGIKIILDALNKVAYDDDKQFVEISAKKYYSENPRAVVRIWEMN
jgi:Holliday junction resolvase RusA-like endonuclease